MISATDLTFSDAELTFMAIELGYEYFPATPLPTTLDVDGWKTVQRGLMARGVMRGHFRLSLDEDVAQVLELVLSADRSLWMSLSFAPGAGQGGARVLWLNDGAVVSHTSTPEGTTTLTVCDDAAIGDMIAAVVDFPDAADSRDGPPQSLPMLALHEAVDAVDAESAAAAAARFPAAAGYLTALAEPRSTRYIESRSAGLEPARRQKLAFAESRVHELWLALDEPHPSGDLDGVMTRVQQVSPPTARAEAEALVREAR